MALTDILILLSSIFASVNALEPNVNNLNSDSTVCPLFCSEGMRCVFPKLGSNPSEAACCNPYEINCDGKCCNGNCIILPGIPLRFGPHTQFFCFPDEQQSSKATPSITLPSQTDILTRKHAASPTLGQMVRKDFDNDAAGCIMLCIKGKQCTLPRPGMPQSIPAVCCSPNEMNCAGKCCNKQSEQCQLFPQRDGGPEYRCGPVTTATNISASTRTPVTSPAASLYSEYDTAHYDQKLRREVQKGTRCTAKCTLGLSCYVAPPEQTDVLDACCWYRDSPMNCGGSCCSTKIYNCVQDQGSWKCVPKQSKREAALISESTEPTRISGEDSSDPTQPSKSPLCTLDCIKGMDCMLPRPYNSGIPSACCYTGSYNCGGRCCQNDHVCLPNPSGVGKVPGYRCIERPIFPPFPSIHLPTKPIHPFPTAANKDRLLRRDNTADAVKCILPCPFGEICAPPQSNLSGGRDICCPSADFNCGGVCCSKLDSLCLPKFNIIGPKGITWRCLPKWPPVKTTIHPKTPTLSTPVQPSRT
jgi:hypothetical protein